jgi:hypothetical protein
MRLPCVAGKAIAFEVRAHGKGTRFLDKGREKIGSGRVGIALDASRTIVNLLDSSLAKRKALSRQEGKNQESALMKFPAASLVTDLR